MKSKSIKITSIKDVNLKMMELRKKERTEKAEERRIKEQIKKTQDEIEKANLWFESETDDNLTETCIYRQKSLSAKLCHLLGKLKPVKSQNQI